MNDIFSMELNSPARLYKLFADILEYPTLAIYDQARECVSVLAPIDDSVCTQLKKFLTFVEEIPLSRLEEVYTLTFDLQAVCIPYAGCHLFGEDPGRGMFMVKLGELYRSRNFNPAVELPDHISVMLRFLSMSNGGEERQELIDYCLIPSVRKMVKCFRENENPYHGILKAVLLALEKERGKDVQCNGESLKENDHHG
jgi:nitrate reductase delta subunit